MEKNKRVITVKGILIICLYIIGVALICVYCLTITGNDRDRITKIISKKYESYEIKDIKLEYVDFYSTVQDAEKSHHRATRAVVIIENKEGQMMVRFKKKLNLWLITNSF